MNAHQFDVKAVRSTFSFDDARIANWYLNTLLTNQLGMSDYVSGYFRIIINFYLINICKLFICVQL